MKRIIICAMLFVLIGCQGYSVTGGPGKTVNPTLISDSTHAKDLVHVNSIALFPIEAGNFLHDNAATALTLNSKLEELARQELNMEVLSGTDLVGKRDKLISIPRAEAFEIARRKKVDALCITTINDFTQRQGSQVGASEQALVDFSMDLYRVDDSKVIWHANYFFKDQAISDNLFRLGAPQADKPNAGWSSADELFASGVRSAYRDLMTKRTAQFIK